jgi:glycosyltransferase involved in cell wall biosynthesis|tara:strand:- start:135 stop:1217 length:1083 start_codon:yes stop_codon:yes gene_type:complete
MSVGGVERSFLSLTEELSKIGHNVNIITLNKKLDTFEYDKSSITFFHLDKKRTLYSIIAISKLINELNPDVFISAQYYANISSIISKLLSKNTPLMILSERLHLSSILSRYSLIKRIILTFLIKKTYKKADLVYGNSEQVCSDLINYVNDKVPIIKILNSSSSENIINKSKEIVSDPWITESSEPIILSVGRLSPQKNIHTLLDAFKILFSELRVKLLIIGNGPDKKIVKDFINNNFELSNFIQLEGEQKNPYKYFKHSKIFVLTSLYEGMPNVLIESQILGVPSVTTDSPGGSSEAVGYGKYGLLAKIKDPEDIANKMKRLLVDESQRSLIQEKMQLSLQRFKPKNISRILIKEIEKLL